MADLNRIRQLAGIVSESVEVNEAPYYGDGNPEEQALIARLDELRKMADRIAFLSAENGPLVKRISAIGGDASGLRELREIAEDLQRSVDAIDFEARSHLSGE